MDSYWKTVRAATGASADAAKTCLFAAVAGCGFTLERTLGPDAWSFVRRSWLLGMPTRHEWQVSLAPEGPHTVVSVRCGLAPRALYYFGMLAGFGMSLAGILVFTGHPERTWLICVIAMGFALPVVHAFAIRVQAGALEKRLWPQLSALRPFAWSHTVLRTLNFAYGQDRIVPSRELGSETR
jgi:hypothetical protein